MAARGAKIPLIRSGKRTKSGKSPGISKWRLSGNPVHPLLVILID